MLNHLREPWRKTQGCIEPLGDIYKVSAIDLPHARRLAFGVVLGQVVVSAAAAISALGLADRRAAISALVGGGIATLGSLVMAALVFAHGPRTSALRIVGALYAGEA